MLSWWCLWSDTTLLSKGKSDWAPAECWCVTACTKVKDGKFCGHAHSMEDRFICHVPKATHMSILAYIHRRAWNLPMVVEQVVQWSMSQMLESWLHLSICQSVFGQDIEPNISSNDQCYSLLPFVWEHGNDDAGIDCLLLHVWMFMYKWVDHCKHSNMHRQVL